MKLPQLKGIAKSGLISLVIKAVGAILSYAMVVSFAHMLGPEEYGRFAAGLNTAIILAAFTGFGFSTGIMRYYPQFLVSGNVAGAKGVMRLGYISVLGSGLALLVLCQFIIPLITKVSGNDNAAYIATVAALSVMTGLGDYSTNLLRAQGKVVVSMLPRDVLWRVLAPLLAFEALIYQHGLNATQALLASVVVLFGLNIWQALVASRIATALGPAKPSVDFSKLRSSLWPLWLALIINAMIGQFDVVIVSAMLSKPEAGAYFAAQKTAQLLSLVLIAGGLTTAPSMAALYHSGKRDELQALCRKMAMAIAGLTIAGFVFLIVVGKLLLGLFDASFVSAYPVLMVLSLGAVIDAMSGPNAYLMQMTHLERGYVAIMTGCYALVLGAQVILIPLMGAMGAAVASASGIILWNIPAIILLRRKAGLDPSLLALVWPPQRLAG